MSVHHIKPVIRGGEDTEDNKVRITRFIHRKWHDLFRELTPQEAKDWIDKVMIAGNIINRQQLDKLYETYQKN